MGEFDAHPGTNKLAQVLSQRMKAEGESPLTLDFGVIQDNMSLLTNTFPVPIPKGEYSVCRHVGGLSFDIYKGDHYGHENQTEKNNTGTHTHKVEPPIIKPGDHVLVGWVQSESVVIDVITKL